jgi:hypothetical protein
MRTNVMMKQALDDSKMSFVPNCRILAEGI